MNKTHRKIMFKQRYLFSYIFLVFLSLIVFNGTMNTTIINEQIIANPNSRPNISFTNQVVNEAPNSSLLEDFFDSTIDTLFDSYTIRGVTISAVKDDKTIFTKGYGYSNYNLNHVVNPNQSLFRIGSISKTFTAIAILQLVEDGLLDLDVDVNTYLTYFKLPETFEDPITLKHLLTHTAGFEESHNASLAYFPAQVPPLEEFVATTIPARVRSPGYISAYSNYGLSLSGYIVQIISGKDFNQYVEDEILSPLGMNFTTFRQPVPSALYSNLSVGYDALGISKSFEYVTQAPAGACSSSASDMAKLMIVLLNNGTYNGTQILKSETVQMMQGVQFQPHPNLPYVGFGLYQMHPNNVKVIGHGGDTAFFHSTMMLLPDENFGLFFSFNSYYGGIARGEVLSYFIETFYPSTNTVEPMNNPEQNLNDFVGRYVTTRRFYSDTTFRVLYPYEYDIEFLEKDFLEESWMITKNDSLLILAGSLVFVQVEPDYFVEKDGQYDFEIGFIRNTKGQVTHFYFNALTSVIAMEKLHPIYGDQIDALLIVNYVVMGLFILSLVWWLIDYIIRLKKKKEKEPFHIGIPKI
ncbi:MAG: serine hydrolase domain-containing protein, partial [Candidatus Heimdallarchaeota archaeon]